MQSVDRRAWAAFFVAHGRLAKRIEAALDAAGLVSLEMYDVLLVLEMHEGHRLRMSDLAARTVYSKSGVTRLVDRMVSEGYVQRVTCPDDRRVVYVELTPHGIAARTAAWPVYRSIIEEDFLGHLSPEERLAIGNGFSRILNALDEPLPVGDEHRRIARACSTATR